MTLVPRRAPIALAALFLCCTAMVAAAQQPASTFAVTGRVIDSESGSGLQYAVVGFPELETWALTDESGAFDLAVGALGTYSIMVVKRGYYFVDSPLSLTGVVDLDIQLYSERADNPVGPGRLIGRVRDAENGEPIGNATLRIVPTGQETETDRDGRFLISDISAGAVLLVFEREGYETRQDTFVALPGVTLALDVQMSIDPIVLEGLDVAVWPRFLEAEGFYRRAERGIGHRFGNRALEENNVFRLSDVFRTVPRVRVGRAPNGVTVMMAQGRGTSRCVMGTYVDGMRMPGMDLDIFPLEAMQAVEIYVGMDAPFEFDHPCGVVLIWTKHGG